MTPDGHKDGQKNATVSGRVSWRCAAFNLRRAAREATRMYDEIMAPSGLTATRFTLLGAIGLQDDITLTALAAMLDLDRTTLTRNLAHLETEGLVTPVSGRDRRERRVSLTGEGRLAVRRALPHWRDAQARLAGIFDDSGWRRMMADLDRITAHATATLDADSTATPFKK